MAIELISKIKPKNNGNFKLVDVQDVEYNGKGLDEAIASGEFKGDKGDRGDIGPMGPTGPTGPKGDNGNDGFSPTVSVAEDVDGVTVTVQNKDGEQTAKVKNGKDGKDYEHSEEFSALAEQVRADKESVEQSKTSVEQTVAQAEGKIDTAGTIAIQGVQNEGTTQTEKVTVEGTKQITEIQSKGEEILHSFPQDFPTQMATKLDKQQGTEHVGKVIAVNEEGNATPLCPNGVRYNSETNNLEYGSDDLPLMEGIKLDDSLTKEGFAADAKVVGDKFDSKLNRQQGVENAGKAVVVGEDGNLVVGDVQSSGGTSDCADAIVNTASGVSPLAIADSSDRAIKDLKLFGKTEQVQTTGAQLFDKNSVVNGVINSNGAVTDNAPLYKTSDYISVKPGVSYTCTETGSKRLKFFDADKQPVQVDSFEDANVEKGATFTTGETTRFIRFSALLEKLDSIMLNEGNSAKPYEPYSGGKPSPSPEFPQEIKSVGKWNEATQKYEVEISISGRNLFDPSACEEGKVFEASGNIISSANGLLTDFIPCLPNSQYSRSRTGLTVVAFYDYNKEKIGFEIVGNTTFITPEKCRYFRYSINKNQVDYTKLIACPGDTVMDYEPYYHKPIFLTLTSDRPITKWDKLVEQGGQIGWLYGTKKYVVTGKENFTYGSENYYMGSRVNMFFEIGDATGSEGIVKDLLFVTSIWHLTEKEGFCVNAKQLHIGLYNTRIGVSDDAAKEEKIRAYKAFVTKRSDDGNPFEIYYKTIETEFVPLPQSEQNAIRALSTYFPTTVITTDGGELDPDVEITYTADTKNYIDNKFAQLQKSLVNTQVQLI